MWLCGGIPAGEVSLRDVAAGRGRKWLGMPFCRDASRPGQWIDSPKIATPNPSFQRRLESRSCHVPKVLNSKVQRLGQALIIDIAMTTQTKPPAYCSHEAATIASLRADTDFAAEYLKAVRDDGDVDELCLAQRRLVAAGIAYRLCE